MCASRAKSQGLRTARLPLGSYVQLDASQVLTVNQVYSILVEWWATRDWKEAIVAAIPQRKIKKVMGEEEEEEEYNDEEEKEVNGEEKEE